MSNQQNNSLDSLINNLKGLVNDAELAAKNLSGKASEQLSSVSEKLKETISEVSANAECVVGKTKEKAVNAAKCADDAVRDNPWKAIGIAAAAGLLIGTLIKRK